ncbi:MAG TPA: SBBP repeat-containing protein, partial [Pyrinomonadaceae bacterium]|nr:SBBP repeat-containing protein [Pyrinomonadaceae bacterium]
MRIAGKWNAALVTIITGFVFAGALWMASEKSHAEIQHKAKLDALSPVSHGRDVRATRAGEAYGKLPLSFEINRGQTDGQVKFLSRGDGYKLFLTSNEAVLALTQKGSQPDVLTMRLVAANSHPEIEGRDLLPGKSNYLIGRNPANWRNSVSTYARVYYHDVYEGIDLVYYGNQGQLEHDFIVAPGANADAIAFTFEGAQNISTDKDGNLSVQTRSGQVTLQKPIVYQMTNGARQEIASSYCVGRNNVSFQVGDYDQGQPLIIDPVLVYSTPLAGNSQDSGNAIAVDAAGNAYVTGETSSTNFPAVNSIDTSLGGAKDAFVVKLNPAGAVVYSTYLGGTGIDSGFDIAVDSANNLYVAGRTSSTDFPVMNAFQSTIGGGTGNFNDIFITKLDASGSALLYSSYYGGSSEERGWGLAVDNSGNAYVSGQAGAGAPVTPNAFLSSGTGLIAKFNTNGSGPSSLTYASYLSPNAGGSTEGRAIAADTTGNVYITGSTTSIGLATPGAFQTNFGGSFDAFVMKINTNLSGTASRIYGTYLGGAGQDFAGGAGAFQPSKAIAIDAGGNVYVTGSTASTDFPVANAYQQNYAGSVDAFLTKLNASGSALVYSTYLGGNGVNSDEGRGVAVNVVGNAYVTGFTGSANFPMTSVPAPLSTTGGIFVTKFSPTGTSLQYSTRLVGPADDQGFAIALDGAGNAFVTGATGPDTFVMQVADPTIIGRVTDENGNPMPGVTVVLTGVPSATTTTDADGYYTFGLLTAGNNYTVSVNIPNYIFNSQTVNNLSRNVRLDFKPEVISIGGQVTLGAGGLDATTMTLSGGKSLSVVTDAGGHYGFINLPAGRNYTVSPSKPGFGFEPTNRTFNNTLVNQTANFIASATFQFSVGSYVASETTGFAVITIQRSSGASGPASVDYLTSNGTASQRTDYTITIGRLNFATEETSKTFRVPITDDLYSEGDETINVTLSNPVGATLGTPNPAQVTITDNDGGNAITNPLDDADARFFVRQHYLDFLNRVPDQGGYDFWSGKITSCGGDQACVRATRVSVSNSFFFELEYQQTGSYVQRLYRASFGNNQPFPNTQTDPNFPNEEKKMPNYSVFSQDRALV